MFWTKELFCCLCLLAGVLALETEPSYLLYTRRNPQQPQTIDIEVESLLRSSYYPLEPTILSIPRWQANSSAAEHTAIVEAQLKRQACNVVTVDLSESKNKLLVVESMVRLVVMLHQQFDVPLERLVLVGFDIGAHLAGAVAAQVQLQVNQPLPRITALDPSDGSDMVHMLSSNDAQLVEVIHTNGQGLGTLRQLGQVDYYPNGGQLQPGCESATSQLANECSHERVLQLAVEMWSPDNELLIAQCATVEVMSAAKCRWLTLRMGEATAPNSIFFLETRNHVPYGKGAYYTSFL